MLKDHYCPQHTTFQPTQKRPYRSTGGDKDPQCFSVTLFMLEPVSTWKAASKDSQRCICVSMAVLHITPLSCQLGKHSNFAPHLSSPLHKFLTQVAKTQSSIISEAFFQFCFINLPLGSCRRGSYYDVISHKCLKCPRGTYQNQDSEKFCYRCPGNTTTLQPGAKSKAKCNGKFHSIFNKIEEYIIYLSAEIFTPKKMLPWAGLGTVHMSRASPANRDDLSHENLYFSTITFYLA